MKNIKQLLNKENWIKYLELADEGGITNHGKAQDIVKEIEEAINYSRCCKSDSEQLFAVLRYAMPDQFTDIALKNIVKGFEEQSK